MFQRFRIAAVMVFGILAIPALAACGSSGGAREIPAATTRFSGPLSAMTEPVTFNASATGVDTCSDHPLLTCGTWTALSKRSTNDQIRIDPVAKTVDIKTQGVTETREMSFSGVDFTSGTTTFGTFTEFFGTLKLLLPGPEASGLDWTSYGVWSIRTSDPFFGGTFFKGGTLSFGVLTPLETMPTTGSASYSGFMDGFYVNASNEVFDLTGTTALTANFENRQITGQFNNILAGGGPGFGDINFAAAIVGNNFSGNASSAGLGQPLSGAVEGSFYGPGAIEAGGVFRMTGGGEHAVGAFAAGQ